MTVRYVATVGLRGQFVPVVTRPPATLAQCENALVHYARHQQQMMDADSLTQARMAQQQMPNRLSAILGGGIWPYY